jgi:predicted amidohydrolase
MKAYVIQPPYSADAARAEECFAAYLRGLDACDESADLIVLPEACDVPCLVHGKEAFLESVERFGARILEAAAAAARRCGAVVCVNVTTHTELGPRNTTLVIRRDGEIAGRYYKQHLTPTERLERGLDGEDNMSSDVTVVELDGLRYGFLTCYDFYFDELVARLARENVDIVIGCSHQRSDTHGALEVTCRHVAYQCNAYLVRASVSMGEDEPLGGCSMIVSPWGEVLINMGSRCGVASAEFDPKKKYYKPAGFGNAPKAHHAYVEDGRRPWKYLPAGPSVIRTDEQLAFPRVCAHRGFNTVAPENSMPAFGAAVALGAEEIEFDLWQTRDGELVSIHDPTLERVSDGEGLVWEHTYEELLRYDFGSRFSPMFAGLRILRLEDVLRQFSCRTVMNIHIKTAAKRGYVLSDDALRRILDTVHRYGAEKHAYYMCGDKDVQRRLRALDPEAVRCMGSGSEKRKIVENALETGCRRVQFYKGYFDREMIDRARENGLICNVFWSDDAVEARQFLDWGIDVILTNDYQRVRCAADEWRAAHARTL